MGARGRKERKTKRVAADGRLGFCFFSISELAGQPDDGGIFFRHICVIFKTRAELNQEMLLWQ